MIDVLQTKVTKLKPGLYGCRVLKNNKPIVELRVSKNEISDAFYDMLRTLNKMGVVSDMADASRHRGKGQCVSAKYIWY